MYGVGNGPLRKENQENVVLSCRSSRQAGHEDEEGQTKIARLRSSTSSRDGEDVGRAVDGT